MGACERFGGPRQVLSACEERVDGDVVDTRFIDLWDILDIVALSLRYETLLCVDLTFVRNMTHHVLPNICRLSSRIKHHNGKVFRVFDAANESLTRNLRSGRWLFRPC